MRDDEAALTADIIAFATEYGRYGYRRIAAMLRDAGWVVNVKRIERIWRREGLKVPQKQPKRGRLWLNDGSCIRLRPVYPNHVWSYDFVEDRTHNGKKYRMLNIIDEFTRECLAIRVSRKLRSTDVIDVLSDLFILRGIPGHIRSDNGPELVAKAVREWIAAVGAKTAYIEPGSPWENRYCESFNSKLRDELLNGEIFYSLQEAKVIIENWRRHYNTMIAYSSGFDFFDISTLARSIGFSAMALLVYSSTSARDITHGQEIAAPYRQACRQPRAHAPNDDFDEPGEARRYTRHHLPTSSEI
jgi:transposase InsO family protein